MYCYTYRGAYGHNSSTNRAQSNCNQPFFMDIFAEKKASYVWSNQLHHRNIKIHFMRTGILI